MSAEEQRKSLPSRGRRVDYKLLHEGSEVELSDSSRARLSSEAKSERLCDQDGQLSQEQKVCDDDEVLEGATGGVDREMEFPGEDEDDRYGLQKLREEYEAVEREEEALRGQRNMRKEPYPRPCCVTS